MFKRNAWRGEGRLSFFKFTFFILPLILSEMRQNDYVIHTYVCRGKTVLQGIPALIPSRFFLDVLLVIIYSWWCARPFCRFLSRRRSVIYYYFTRVKNRYKLNGRNSDRQQWAQYRRFHGRLFEFLIPCNFGHHCVHKWWTERRGSLRTCLFLRSFFRPNGGRVYKIFSAYLYCTVSGRQI